MIKAVIFDLYGTLLRLAAAPTTHLTILRNADVSDLRGAIERTMSFDLPTLRDFCRRLGVPTPPDIDELDAELDREINSVDLYPDVTPTLRALTDADVQIGMISNLATPYKTPFFTHSLDVAVHVSLFSCDCGLLKPDPQIYGIALDRLGVSASDAIMVGDSLRCDVTGPSAVGIAGVHLARNGGSNADNAIESLDQIVQYAT